MTIDEGGRKGEGEGVVIVVGVVVEGSRLVPLGPGLAVDPQVDLDQPGGVN